MNVSSFRTPIVRLLLAAALLALSSLACLSTGPRPTTVPPTARPGAKTSTPSGGKTGTPAAAVGAKTWTVMLYFDADDPILEQDMWIDLNEAERVGSNSSVNLVAQIDRYKKGYAGAQDFSTARRFYLTKDADLDVIHSKELADLGEVNMASGVVLTDFVTWAIKNYPAAHYALILSDHGAGWPGGWTDRDMKADTGDDVEIEGFGDMLYLNELDQALSDVQRNTGVKQLDLVGMDACLMSALEVVSQLTPYTRYVTASEETEPSLGWAYAAFLQKLADNPAMDGAALGKAIVDTYINQDTLMVDDAARSDYLKRAYDTDESVSADELIAEESKKITLSTVDVSKAGAVVKALDDLARAMSNVDQKYVARARSHTLAFESVFGDQNPAPYIDLGHFASLVKNESEDQQVGIAADALRKAIGQAVVAEKHGPRREGATGISIYFPNSTLFKTAGTNYATYDKIAGRLASGSLWDDFLTFHYTGQKLEPNNRPVKPIVGPGASVVNIDPIEVSGHFASPTQPVTLSTTISGGDVAYIYLFTGQLDNNDVLMVDVDYLESDSVKEVDGVVYPDWGNDGSFPLEFDWYPVRYVIDDGKKSAPVLLWPESYGEAAADTVYSVDGYYHFTSGEADRYARLFFSGEGDLLYVMGFTGMEDVGPMHEITPVSGDQFTILERWAAPGDNGGVVFTSYESETLTFGRTAWTWWNDDAPAGQYLVGIIVEDMDGNIYYQYAVVEGG